MLELDYVLERYLDEHFDRVSAEEQARFQSLLTAQDPELQGWLLSGIPHPDATFHPLVQRIRGI